MVYGGGGIIPDVFVPIGTNEEEAVESIDSFGWLSYFIFEHLDENREQYADYTRQEFIDDYKVDDIMFESFVDYLIQRNLKMDFYEYEDAFKTYIKAALAEQLFDANAHAEIKSSEDAMLQEVLKLDSAPVRQDEAAAIETRN